MGWISGLRGTIETIVSVGKTTANKINLKTGSGSLDIRNSTDAAYSEVRALTGTTADGLTTKAYVDAAVPTGIILAYEANSTNPSVPSGWLLCDGQAVSRTGSTAALFALIGTSHGAGNGSTTFNVPDYRGRILCGFDNMGGSSANRMTNAQADTVAGAQGAETHTLSSGEMPAHTHNVGTRLNPIAGANGAAGSASLAADNQQPTSSTGSGGAHNNVQPTTFTNFIIKT